MDTTPFVRSRLCWWWPLALVAFPAGLAYAENALLLESFESGIDNVASASGGWRPFNGGVAPSAYLRTGPNYTNVTEGDKSLKIELSGVEFWSVDYSVTLSPEASQKLREAFGSTNAARYILRYDLIFPKAGNGGVVHWINSQCLLGALRDLLQADTGGKRTMSVSLDLLQATDIPGQLDITLDFSDSFDAIQDPFMTPIALYLDNIRLVDTYAPGAVPVVTKLQSFEDGTGGVKVFTEWGGTLRTSFFQYTATGPNDIHVTDGQRSLKVAYQGKGDEQADFTLGFANTYLAQLLKLDQPADQRPTPDQLARYTLRFDVIFPDKGADWNDEWVNLRAHTLADAFPWELVRNDGTNGRRQTTSITLDQIKWADWPDDKPVLMFTTMGAWGAAGTTLYLDNFRIIDTGNVPSASLGITGFDHDSVQNQITLTWTSQPGKTYSIVTSTDLKTWSTTLAAGIPASSGLTTTHTTTVPVGAQLFLRVRLD